MKRFSLPLLITAISLVTLLALVVGQSSKVQVLRADLKTQTSNLRKVTQENRQLIDENMQLEDEIQLLRDSIVSLNREIATLRTETKEQKEKIKKLYGRIDRREKRIEGLNDQIEKLAQQEGNNWRKINELEKEKKKLRLQLEGFEEDKAVLKEKQKTNTAKIERIQDQQQTLHQIDDIAQATSVRFDRIALRKDPRRSDIRKVKYDRKTWKYTVLEFFLEHPQQKALLKEEFLVKIVDLDTGKTLPFNENNPQYPGSQAGAKGYTFTYNGNMAEVLYYNNEPKQSQNYEVRVYYVKNGKTYPLKNGKKVIVQNGKPLPI